MSIITLFLTCANIDEADKITQVLLDKKLAVCIKKSKVSSSFLWKGSIGKSEEILLIMDSIEEKFAEIEREVRKIHSYSTFVLLAVPAVKASKGIEEWVKKELS